MENERFAKIVQTATLILHQMKSEWIKGHVWSASNANVWECQLLLIMFKGITHFLGGFELVKMYEMEFLFDVANTKVLESKKFKNFILKHHAAGSFFELEAIFSWVWHI